MKSIFERKAMTFLFLFYSSLVLSVVPQTLFKQISLDEATDKKQFKLEKMVIFNKTDGDATELAKATFSYFSGPGCLAADLMNSYTTIDSSPGFSLSNNKPFGLNASSTYQLGETLLNLNMDLVGSIAVVLRSSNNDVPQGDFSGDSCGTNPIFCCIDVTCSASKCLSSGNSVARHHFTLKKTEAIGDPANGGKIACSKAVGGMFNLIVPAIDQSDGIEWGGLNTEVGMFAQTILFGSFGTNAIVNVLGSGSYAAQLCNDYVAVTGADVPTT
jgi:hypothetical protein